MPRQSKFLLNIICGSDNSTEEIRGKIQCIPSGHTANFTNLGELHEFLLNEIHSKSENLEFGQSEIKDDTLITTGFDQ